MSLLILVSWRFCGKMKEGDLRYTVLFNIKEVFEKSKIILKSNLIFEEMKSRIGWIDNHGLTLSFQTTMWWFLHLSHQPNYNGEILKSTDRVAVFDPKRIRPLHFFPLLFFRYTFFRRWVVPTEFCAAGEFFRRRFVPLVSWSAEGLSSVNKNLLPGFHFKINSRITDSGFKCLWSCSGKYIRQWYWVSQFNPRRAWSLGSL